MQERLNESNFIVHAMKHYDNPQCSTVEEFEEDLKKFLYLKKLLARYARDGDLKERLILNHIIILYNVFNEEATNMLFYKIDKEYWPYLASFLTYLDRMPEVITNYSLVSSEIELDTTILSKLEKL